MEELIPVNVQSFAQAALPSCAYSGAQVRDIDQFLIEEQGIPGLTLMKRAAAASVQLLVQQWPEARFIRVYCGSGNNAADGYIVAGMLAEQSQVEVVVVGDTAKLTADGQRAYQYCQASKAKLVGTASQEFKSDVIVDALLGTGFRGQPREAFAKAIAEINQDPAEVIALDVPSGLALDTEQDAHEIVLANQTVTFIAIKQGLLTGYGKDVVGQLYLAPLTKVSLPLVKPLANILVLQELLQFLPKRANNAHKFQFGHILVVGGDEGMGGAPLMAALAAIRCGAGLVSLATHPGHAAQLVGLHPELMVRGVHDAAELKPLLEAADVVALGPGLGKGVWGQEMYQAAVETNQPLVLDADGLNLLAKEPRQRGQWILTPHPGEAKRLLDRDFTQRFSAAEDIQQRFGGVTVLKGAGTLVADDSGTDICPYGNPGMSTAGMGDVLCGVIAGVFGQCRDLGLAARLGTVLHSAAADSLARQHGMRGLMATDLIPEVRRLLNDV